MTIQGKYTRQKEQQVQRPKGRIVLRTVNKMEMWRGQRSGLVGMVRSLEMFCVMRILWDGFKQ